MKIDTPRTNSAVYNGHKYLVEECKQMEIEIRSARKAINDLLNIYVGHRELIEECRDYLKSRNLGETADDLLVKCCQILARDIIANTPHDLPRSG